MRSHLRRHPWDFLSVSGLISAVGVIGLALIGLPEVRRSFKGWIAPAIWTWAKEYAILVIVILALLTIVPMFVEKLRENMLLKGRELMKNTELSTAAASFSQRTAHLITKTQDVIAGEIDTRYIDHTLLECRDYFKQRAIQVNGVTPDSKVEAVLFQVFCGDDGTPNRLDRKRFTHSTAGDFAPTFTRFRNKSAGDFLDQLITARNPFFADDENSRKVLLDVMKMQDSEYSEFLIVPVHLDRKISGSKGIYGALMLMSDQKRTFRSIDHVLLSVYAWYCSAALSADRVVKSV